MKKLVLYCSITGGTKKVAEAIAEELKCEVIDLRKTPVSEIPFNDLDYLFIGSGVYGGKLHNNMLALTKNKDFLQAITENIKTLGLFSTYAGSPDSSKKAINDFKQALPTVTQTNLEEFYCKGTLFKIFGMGRPVAKDLEKGRMWAKQIVSR